MRHGLYLLYIVALMSAFTACTESDELTTGTTPGGKQTEWIVAPYPAFTEGTQTRSEGVGTFDPGKSRWEKGDEILVYLRYGTKGSTATLVYDGTDWNMTGGPLYEYSGYSFFWIAYSPGLEFSDVNFAIKDGYVDGTFEYIIADSPLYIEDDALIITFSKRHYNRLRIAAGAETPTLSVEVTGFQPPYISASYYLNDADYGDYTYTLTPDENGNAYLYGIWEEGATLTVKGTVTVDGAEREWLLCDKVLPTLADDDRNLSFVADARLSYKNEGNGTAANPYRICHPRQLASLAEAVNSGTFADVSGGIYVALENDIDLSGYPDWTPIGRSTTHPFIGTFDGQGHTISNLTISNNNPDNDKEWGLFGMVQDATIKNVRVDGSITLSNFGNGDDGGYDNKDGIGGIAGRCKGTVNFYGCHNNVDISGTGNEYYAAIGGIVGFQIDGAVTLVACMNTGTLQASGEGVASQIPTAGFIGDVYKNGSTTTVTADANYCNAEMHSEYDPCVFFSDSHGTSTLSYTVSSNYWMKVNGSPSYIAAASNINGFTEVNGSDVTWQTAKEGMNAYLSANYSDFGYEYVANTGEDADRVPLILKSKTTEP